MALKLASWVITIALETHVVSLCPLGPHILPPPISPASFQLLLICPRFHLWNVSCSFLPQGFCTCSSLCWHLRMAGYFVLSVSPEMPSQATFLKNPNHPPPQPISVSVIFFKALNHCLNLFPYFCIVVLSYCSRNSMRIGTFSYSSECLEKAGWGA